MGADNAGSASPGHPLDLPAYYLDKTEVTNAMYAKFVQATGFQTKGDWRSRADGTKFDPAHFDVNRDPHPVVNVTWDDAAAYCKWAGRRLPTEAEWEKAARGGDKRLWPWGNEPHPEFANVDVGQEEEPDTKPVGSFARDASPAGILDLAGNVREWTASIWHDYPLTNPSEESPGTDRHVVRGASAFSLRDAIEVTRRIADPNGAANKDLGFRCAVSADQATRR
jgi:formylglycine-generating enzyme required for sulfatase activity